MRQTGVILFRKQWPIWKSSYKLSYYCLLGPNSFELLKWFTIKWIPLITNSFVKRDACALPLTIYCKRNRWLHVGNKFTLVLLYSRYTQWCCCEAGEPFVHSRPQTSNPGFDPQVLLNPVYSFKLSWCHHLSLSHALLPSLHAPLAGAQNHQPNRISCIRLKKRMGMKLAEWPSGRERE